MMRTHAIHALAFALVLAAPAVAQQRPPSFDRRALPTAGATPELRVPGWTKSKLPNGAQVVVSPRHTLPLVSFTINFIGGAAQFDPADKPGVGNLVASMLTEGTTTRTGDQIAEALQSLGTSVSVGVTSEAGTISFLATKDKLAPTIAIVADLIENPSFPQASLDRLRGSALVTLTQAKDRPSSIATVVFPKVLYTTDHPYGRSRTEESMKAITRDDIVAFHRAYYQPGRAVITIAGDVTPAEAQRLLEQGFANWKAGGSIPSFTYPAVPQPKATTIYLVDKPGAEQSSFSLGHVGPPRATPDYYALRVMNTMLGGIFQSRLNHNIREQKGWSYGVGSSFAYGRGPGPFRSGGEIATAKTDSGLMEFMKELRGIRGDRPVTDDELEQSKSALVQSLPGSFASVSGVNANIATIFTQSLPDDYYQQFSRGVNAVTKDDVVRVARQHIDTDRLAILIVGDRAKIEGPLAALKLAPIVILDIKGDVVREPVRP